MAIPFLKPKDRTEVVERHHTDPPALWMGVLTSSVVIHLFAFLILRLLLVGRSPNSLFGQDFIPVDLVVLAPNAPALTQPIQTPNSATTSQPTTGRTSDQGLNRQTPLASTPPSTSTNSQLPVSNSSQSQSSDTQFGQQISPIPTPIPPAGGQSGQPFPIPSPNPPSGGQSGQPFPNPSPNPPSGGQSGQPFPNPSPNPPSGGPPEPTPSPPQQSSGFRAIVGGLNLVDSSRDVPDRPARLKQGSRTTFPSDYLTRLGINPTQALSLRVKVLIESTGKPSVLPNSAEVSSGNLSASTAEQLAREIIEGWTFEPTYMGSGPVDNTYYIELNITPASN